MPDDAPEPAPAEARPTPPPTPDAAPKDEPKEDWETRFKYLFADFENFRRRALKDKEATGRQARAALLHELLPLVEAFRAATTSVTHLAPSDPLRRGFELLDREWTTFLKHEGVEPVAEPGRPFVADEAEAVGEIAATDARPAGTIVEVVQQGYRFYGGLLRPAKVIVARAPGAEGRVPGAAAPGEERPEAES
jgi:molecular chaperone GrpE